MTEFGLENVKISSVPMSVSYYKTCQDSNDDRLLSNEGYQKLIGCLLYISVNTRPDILASISILTQKVNHPLQEDWNELKRVLKYLKGTSHLKLALGNNEDLNKCCMDILMQTGRRIKWTGSQIVVTLSS